MNKHKKGFTLIELLVVLSIISLLTSVILATLQGARDKAVNAKKAAMVNQYVRALELVYDKDGSYPFVPGSESINYQWCLGYAPGEYCYNSSGGAPIPVVGNAIINSNLARFIAGPPASRDPIIAGSANYNGVVYTCMRFENNKCLEYFLVWDKRGAGTSCAGGFLNGGHSGSGATDSCVYASNPQYYQEEI